MPAKVADPEVLPLGPITRSRARKFREVLSLTYTKLSDSFDDVSALDNKLFNVLHTDVEDKEHDVGDLSLARLKFRRERTRAQELKPSSVEAWRFVCSSFKLNEADTPSASSIQLISAMFSSTSALLAQLKLNNPEAGETRPTCGGVSHGFRDTYDPLGVA
ncbi:hypothetical protein GQ457_10G010240 [Hibiscus cannabinus]